MIESLETAYRVASKSLHEHLRKFGLSMLPAKNEPEGEAFRCCKECVLPKRGYGKWQYCVECKVVRTKEVQKKYDLLKRRKGCRLI
jgi:hypothetical protein